MPLEFSHVTVTAALVSAADAKEHLRITDTDHDSEVQDKLDAAQAHIIAKLGAGGDETWTEATVPKPIRHAILIMLEAFWDRDYNNDTQQWAARMKAIDDLVCLWCDYTL